MSPRDSCPTIGSPRHSSVSEAHENDLKTNFMKMVELHKEEMKKSLKEIQENTNNWRIWINPLKKAKGKKAEGKE